MDKNKVTAMHEAVFYFTFGSNLKYLKGLLENIISKEIYEMIPLNTKLLKDNLMSKSKYLDYVVKTNEGICNIEINNFIDLGIIRRNITYLCQLVANSSRKGKSYKTIPNTIQINFCRLGSDTEPYQEYTLYAKEHKNGYPDELSNMIKIVIINIDYYSKMYYNDNKKFIKNNALICAIGLPLEEVKKLAKENELVMEYKEDLEKILDDEDFVKWISPEEEEEKMKQTYIDMGLEQGKEDGFMQGKVNEKLEIAKKMLSEKFEMAIISNITGLSIEELRRL